MENAYQTDLIQFDGSGAANWRLCVGERGEEAQSWNLESDVQVEWKSSPSSVGVQQESAGHHHKPRPNWFGLP